MMNEIDDFINYLLADKGYSKLTAKEYRSALQSLQIFYRSLDNQLTWYTLDADVVRQWMAREMARGENARTISKQLSGVRSFYKYMRRVGRMDHSPVTAVKSPKIHPKLPSFLRNSEVNQLFDDIDYPSGYEGMRDRTILLTFYHTGIRLAELIGLDVEDIDLNQRELKVTGKRNKQRIVPFSAELANAFKAYLPVRQAYASTPGVCELSTDAGALFFNRRKLRIDRRRVGLIVKHYLSLVTTQRKKSPHVLRHTFASAMLNNGADLEAIKELLGHESVATTEVYTHTTFADLKKQYKLAHPRA